MEEATEQMTARGFFYVIFIRSLYLLYLICVDLFLRTAYAYVDRYLYYDLNTYDYRVYLPMCHSVIL